MSFLFVALSVLTVVVMASAKAVSHSPPMNQLPAGPPPIVMQIGEVWGVQGTIDKDMTDAAWASFRDTLAGMMKGLGADVGQLMTQGPRDFAVQVKPTTSPVTIYVPMFSPPFTITKAQKLNAPTQSPQISGYRYRRYS
jgi:hypothetical protein